MANIITARIDKFKHRHGRSSASCRSRTSSVALPDAFFNNAMVIVILLAAIIAIAILQPKFLSLSSIINIISLTAAKLPIALGHRRMYQFLRVPIFRQDACVGLTACIAASLLQVASYSSKMFPGIGVMPLWPVRPLAVIAVGAIVGLVNGFFVRQVQAAPVHRHPVHPAHRATAPFFCT